MWLRCPCRMIVIVVVSCKLFVVSDGKEYFVAERDCKGNICVLIKQKLLMSFVVFECDFLSTNGRLMQGGGNFVSKITVLLTKCQRCYARPSAHLLAVFRF